MSEAIAWEEISVIDGSGVPKTPHYQAWRVSVVRLAVLRIGDAWQYRVQFESGAGRPALGQGESFATAEEAKAACERVYRGIGGLRDGVRAGP